VSKGYHIKSFNHLQQLSVYYNRVLRKHGGFAFESVSLLYAAHESVRQQEGQNTVSNVNGTQHFITKQSLCLNYPERLC